jgi:very-long-chain (3R)-3-hydroxyacyl-CoA dehydratase
MDNGGNKSYYVKLIVKLATIIQTLGWILLFGLTLLLVVYELQGIPTASLKLCILQNLKIFQSFQAIEILFSLFGLVGGSAVFSLMQIIGRLMIVFCFIDLEMQSNIYWNIVLCWSLADIIRNLFYLCKNSFTGFLRYNCFILLYPIGVTGEVRAIENNLRKNNYESNEYVIALRTLQVVIICGLFVLYTHLLKQRRKYYLSSQEKKTA